MIFSCDFDGSYWNIFDDGTSPDDEVDRKKYFFCLCNLKNNEENFYFWMKNCRFKRTLKGWNKLENLLN